jgi:putative hydrolase of the HAD superfamily
VSVPVQAVFFDFAGTLFSDRALRAVHLEQLKFVADQVGVTATDRELRTAYRQGLGTAYWSVAQQDSYLHRELFGAAFAAMAEALGGTLDEAGVKSAVDLQYRATISAAVLRPDVLETLGALRASGIHVQIVSNIDQEQLDGLLDSLRLRPVLDAWTCSEEADSCKPDPGIYRIALAKSGCEAESVLFVGDSIVHDIEGPAALGLQTAWLTADAKPGHSEARPDHQIERIADVLPIVARELVG